mgnify:CR=1 FL=1
MTIQRAFKTKLRLNNEQRAYFYGCAGAARFVYNWALADRIERHKAGEQGTNKFEQKRRFNAWKLENAPWLAEYPYVLVERAFDDLDAAYKNFFRRVKQGAEEPGFPKFRTKRKDAPRFCLGCNGVTVEADKIKLPRIGWVTLEERGYIPTANAKLNRVTLSERAGDWYVSVQMEMPEPAKPVLSGSIGVDLGIKALATTSDGRTFDNPKAIVKYERRLARLQRELHRRVKGSRNRSKTKTKIAKLHQRIADVRIHTLHDISAHVVYTMKPERVVLEDLNIKGMAANRHLAKAVADAGMGELARQIEYKAGWIGVEVVHADRWYPSTKTCSGCGHVQDMPLSVRVYECQQCGLVLDRDLNAARNLAMYVTA